MFHHSYGVFLSPCRVSIFHVLTCVCCPSSFHCTTLRRFWLHPSTRGHQRVTESSTTTTTYSSKGWTNLAGSLSPSAYTTLSSPISCLLGSFQCFSVSLVLGSPNWVQCSSSSLRRARHSGRITSLNLLATFLFLFSAQYDIHHQIIHLTKGMQDLLTVLILNHFCSAKKQENLNQSQVVSQY